MRKLRTSIAGMMGLILVGALGLAALRSATEAWAALVLAVTLGLLGFAILGAIYRRDDGRAWWAGFALFGWGYLLLAFGPWVPGELSPRPGSRLLLTTVYQRLRMANQARLVPPAVSSPVRVRPAPPASPGRYVRAALSLHNKGDDEFAKIYLEAVDQYRDMLSAEDVIEADHLRALLTPGIEPPETFLQIGVYLMSLLAATVGGLAARVLRAPRGPLAPATGRLTAGADLPCRTNDPSPPRTPSDER